MSILESKPLVQIRACKVEELADGIGREVEVAGKSIAIFRTRRGDIRAVENKCPHKGGPLAEGIVVGDQIVCPMHARRYTLISGQCDQTGECGVAAYGTRVESGWVVVSISVDSK